MSRRPKLLILKAGATAPEIAREHGDYDRWFIRSLGHPERFSVVEFFRGEPLPDPGTFDGVIVTGSPLSVCEPEPWMDAAGAALRAWAEEGRAVLGVCFGHQLLSYAFGTPVIRNPQGREIGTIQVELTEEGRRDPLFEGLSPILTVQATHRDIAADVPVGSRLLAGNSNTAAQALRFGRRARGVQFHPELSAEIMRTMLRSRQEILAREHIDSEAREREVAASPDGGEILRRFEERFAGE